LLSPSLSRADGQDALAAENKTRNTSQDERYKSSDKRRAEKLTTVKKMQDALDVLVKDTDESKKRRAVDDKKPGTQAVLDALK
jgi:hypothetical protein